MANKITTAGKFIPLLDEVYRTVSLTAKLDGPEELVRQGANANELIIPMIEMQGLGDYDRNSGYVAGDVTMTNETVKCNFDRGRMFTVDNMDDADSAGIAFGRLAGEFIRTKVAPELDAFRFASYASKEGVTQKAEDLAGRRCRAGGPAGGHQRHGRGRGAHGGSPPLHYPPLWTA